MNNKNSRLEVITRWVNGTLGELSHVSPVLLAATPEAMCNLECEHCYWRHDITQSSVDWEPSVQQILKLIQAQEEQGEVFSVVYAGRILSARGFQFLQTFLSAVDATHPNAFFLAIVDNGYTIFKQPALLSRYKYINISVDGWRDAHDVQRRKEGSFDVAWGAILELKKQGFDPIVASAVGPLSVPSWRKFDELLAEHDVRSSVTLVWNMESTFERKVACIKEDKDVLAYFEMLISGVPRLVNLYDIRHVELLRPLLKQFVWSVDSSGDGLVAHTENGSHVIWRPTSTSLFREVELLWDGRVTTPEAVGRVSLSDLNPNHFRGAVQKALREREVWGDIPISL